MSCFVKVWLCSINFVTVWLCSINFVTVWLCSINFVTVWFLLQYGCVVSTCADGSVKMWSHRGVEITTLYGHTQRANGCDISVKLVDEKQGELFTLERFLCFFQKEGVYNHLPLRWFMKKKIKLKNIYERCNKYVNIHNTCDTLRDIFYLFTVKLSEYNFHYSQTIFGDKLNTVMYH